MGSEMCIRDREWEEEKLEKVELKKHKFEEKPVEEGIELKTKVLLSKPIKELKEVEEVPEEEKYAKKKKKKKVFKPKEEEPMEEEPKEKEEPKPTPQEPEVEPQPEEKAEPVPVEEEKPDKFTEVKLRKTSTVKREWEDAKMEEVELKKHVFETKPSNEAVSLSLIHI